MGTVQVMALNPARKGNMGRLNSSQPLYVYDTLIAQPWLKGVIAQIRGEKAIPGVDAGDEKAGEFVLLDDSIHIVVHVCAEHNAVLRLAVHGLRIQVVALVCILHEPALLLEMGKLLGTAFINARVVFAGAFGEIDFGFDDMIERFEVIACFGAGFLRTQYIVGAAFHFFH